MLTVSSFTPSVTTMTTAVIGAGAIAEQHFKFLQSRSNVRIVGVCDASVATAQFAREMFGVERAYTDAGEMIEALQPDCVHVLTPPNSHVHLVEMALEAGAHVVCEKPMAANATEVERLLSLASSRGLNLYESHNYRFNQPIRQIMAEVEGGGIGEVRDIEVRAQFDIRSNGARFADENRPSPVHLMPAGALHDFITHLAYLALLPSPVKRFEHIHSVWSNHGGGTLFTVDDLDSICVAETERGPVHIRIRFNCTARPEELRLTVYGTQGSVSAELMNPHVQITKNRAGGRQLTPIVNQVVNGLGAASTGPRNLYAKVLGRSPYEGLHEFLSRVYDAFQLGSEPPVSSQDIIDAARFVDALILGQGRS